MAQKTTDTGDIAEQIRIIQADIASLTESIKALGAERVEAGADALRDAAYRAGETMRMSAEDARRRGEVMAQDLEERIAANPLSAVLIATGVGLVLGALFSRR